MNWGNKLVLVFIAFGGLMTYMVSRCISTPVNLVSKEYYKDELAYQQVIDGTNLTGTLTSDISISVKHKYIQLRFPGEMKSRQLTGQIWFYCPYSNLKDKKVSIATDGEAEQRISRDSITDGHYLVKINWHSGNRHYYTEQKLSIN
jgi:hypothetical protein